MEALTLFTMENRSEIDEPTLSCLGEVIEIFRNKNLISTYASRRILRLLAISPYVPTSVYRKFMHGNDDPILNAFVTGLHLIDVFNLEDSLDMESVLTLKGLPSSKDSSQSSTRNRIQLKATRPNGRWVS